jgi:hypothetical protein
LVSVILKGTAIELGVKRGIKFGRRGTVEVAMEAEILSLEAEAGNELRGETWCNALGIRYMG